MTGLPLLVGECIVVLAPGTVAAISLHRLTVPRIRTPWLHAAVSAVSVLLTLAVVRAVAIDAMLPVGLALAALATPMGWALTEWVARSHRSGLYGDREVWRRRAAASTAMEDASRPFPLLLKEAARVRPVTKSVERARPRPAAVFRSRQAAVENWPGAISLPFVPSADGRH